MSYILFDLVQACALYSLKVGYGMGRQINARQEGFGDVLKEGENVKMNNDERLKYVLIDLYWFD